jgi:uncharacterized protein (DUF952 family)
VLIFKIIYAEEWRGTEGNGAYAGSVKDRADGFLHFSTAAQVPGTLAKYYAGRMDLVLVCVDGKKLGSALKFEPSRDGALYPHLYGTLVLSAVNWVRPLTVGVDGAFTPPPELEAALG